jgi:peroxiredoxin
LVLLLNLFVGFWLGPRSDASGSPPGEAPPDFRLATPSGEAVTLSALRGSVVLLDFWATWCESCQDAFACYGELLERYQPQGFAVVAVSVDETEADLQRFLERQPPPFTVVWDEEQAVVASFAPEAMPASYLLDRAGSVRHHYLGFEAGSCSALETDLEGLLAASPAPSAPQQP